MYINILSTYIYTHIHTYLCLFDPEPKSFLSTAISVFCFVLKSLYCMVSPLFFGGDYVHGRPVLFHSVELPTV